MNDLETILSRIPPRPVPSPWRAEILRAARAVAPELACNLVGQDAQLTDGRQNACPTTTTPAWWRRWISPQRLGFAAAWLIIAILRASTPDGDTAPSPATVAQFEERVSMQWTLIAELLHPPAPSPQPRSPAPHGAMLRMPQGAGASCSGRLTHRPNQGAGCPLSLTQAMRRSFKATLPGSPDLSLS